MKVRQFIHQALAFLEEEEDLHLPYNILNLIVD